MKKLNKKDYKYMFEPKYGVPDRYFTDEEEKAIFDAKQQGQREIRINDESVGLGYGARHIIKNPDYFNPDAELDQMIDEALKKEFHRQFGLSNGAYPFDFSESERLAETKNGENPVYDRWLKASKEMLPRAIEQIKNQAFKTNPTFKKRYDDYQDYKEKVSGEKPYLAESAPKARQGNWDGFYRD